MRWHQLMRIALLTLLATPMAAFALDPSRLISQYGHTSWTLQQGVLPGTPTVMTQTADGYLWVGTRSGLARFDGVSFVPFVPPKEADLQSSRILSLHGSRDGSLWIGTRAGLERWHNGHLTFYADALGQIPGILEDPSGKIWFTRMTIHDDKGPLCEVAESRSVCHGAKDGVSIEIGRELRTDARRESLDRIRHNTDAVARWCGTYLASAGRDFRAIH